MLTIMIVALGVEGIAIILLSAGIISSTKTNELLLKEIARLRGN